ncbi:Secretin Receptor [Manis pentadactyla]|nr:Secretin Receptor [Manis pentadactyla]
MELQKQRLDGKNKKLQMVHRGGDGDLELLALTIASIHSFIHFLENVHALSFAKHCELYSADDINYCLPEVLLIKKMEPIEQFQERSLGSLTRTEDVVIICHIIIVPSVHMMTLRTVLQLADEHKD